MTHSIQYHRYIDIAGYVNAFHALSGNEVKFSGFMPNNTWECSQLTYIHTYIRVCLCKLYLFICGTYISVSHCLYACLSPVCLPLLALHFSKQNLGNLGAFDMPQWSDPSSLQPSGELTAQTWIYIYIYTLYTIHIRQAFGFCVAIRLALGICECIRLPSF